MPMVPQESVVRARVLMVLKLSMVSTVNIVPEAIIFLLYNIKPVLSAFGQWCSGN